MSNDYQMTQGDAGNIISNIMQSTEQVEELSDIDATLVELQAAVDKVQEVLITHWLEVFEAFGFIGVDYSVDNGDDGIIDEELDLSDVPEAER